MPRRDHSRIRRTSSTISEIVTRLENPEVRLPDNSEYKVDEETLGRLYTHTVLVVAPERSAVKNYGRVGRKAELMQRTVQSMPRSTLYSFLGELELRRKNRSDLLEEVEESLVGVVEPRRFSEGTIAREVSELALEGRFRDIGIALKQGARAYAELEPVKRGMRNYRFAAEYKAILSSLKGV